MVNLIERLKKSDNKLIAASVKDASKWARLRHTKPDLELLLTYNIVEISFRPKNKLSYEKAVVTGNTRLINVYKAVNPKDKASKLRTQFTGIHTKNNDSVMAYDLIDGKLKTIDLESWEITNILSITEDNVEVLDMLIKECLEKSKKI